MRETLPGQVRTALLLRLVRTPGTHCRGRTGSKSAPRFAPYYPRLARTWAVNTTLVNTEIEQRLLRNIEVLSVTEDVTADVTAKRAVSDHRIIDDTFQGYQAAGYHAGHRQK